MPEIVIPDKYADSIPRFNLPKEFTNPPESEPPKESPAQAVTPETPVKPEAKAEPEVKAETKPEVKAEVKETAPVAEKTEEAAPPASKGVDKRIARAVQAKLEAQSRAEALQREIEALKSQKTPAPSTAPRMEDFTDVQEYAKAYASFEKDNYAKEQERVRQESIQTQARTHLENLWSERLTKGIEKYDDFEEVVGDLKPTTPWAIAIMEEDNGEDVAHYLGRHPSEAEKIFALSPLGQAREIGKLSFKLSQKPATPQKPSAAPAPITPVTGAAQASGDEYSPGMPFKDYLKIGNKMFRRGH